MLLRRWWCTVFTLHRLRTTPVLNDAFNEQQLGEIFKHLHLVFVQVLEQHFPGDGFAVQNTVNPLGMGQDYV